MAQNETHSESQVAPEEILEGDFLTPEEVHAEVADAVVDTDEVDETTAPVEVEHERKAPAPMSDSGAVDPLAGEDADKDANEEPVADVVGVALADQLDELINLANSGQSDGGSGQAGSVEDMFSSPEESFAATGDLEDEVDDAVDIGDVVDAEGTPSLHASTEQSESDSKIETSQELEPKVAVADDDNEGMDGEFATLDDVINEDGSTDASDKDESTAADEAALAAAAPADADSEEPADDIFTGVEDAADEHDHGFESVDEVISDQPRPETASPDVSSLEATDEPLAEDALINQETDAVAPVDGDDFDMEASFETVEQVTSPTDAIATDPVTESATVTTDEAASAEGMPISQIDEMLAEQADTAVAGDFETPGEILAAEQVSDSLDHAGDDPAEFADDDMASFATADDVLGSPDKEPKSIDCGTIMEAPLLHPGEAEAEAETAEAIDEPAVDIEGSFDDVEVVDASDDHEVDIPHEVAGTTRSADVASGGLITIVTGNIYRFCELTNRPLQSASDSTKRMVGLIGLITVANATLIMLGSIVFG